MPVLNLFWVGPQASGQYKGHDTIGADLFRDKYPEQDIHFYCLDEEVEHYNDYFNSKQPGKKAIIVHGIESTVASVETPQREEFLALIALTKERVAALDEPKAKIQEFVGLKDAFAHYFSVLVKYGGAEQGFAIDSNVMPTDAFTAALPELKDYSSSFLFDERLGGWRADPWLMYITGDEKADERFNGYLKQVKQYIAMCVEDGEFVSRGEMVFTTNYGELSAHTLISSQFSYWARDAKSLEASHPPENYLNSDELVIETCGFLKRYNNSHTDSRLRSSPILHRIVEGSISAKAELKYYLRLHEIDGLDEYEYEIEGPMLTAPKKLTTTLFDIVSKRGRHDIGALLLALSTKEAAIDKAINSYPYTKCLEQYIDLRFIQVNFDEASFLIQLNQLVDVTAKVLGYPPLKETIPTLEALCAQLRKEGAEGASSVLTCFKLMMSEGPLSADTLSNYADKLHALYQTHKPGYSPTQFTQAASEKFSRGKIEEMLTEILPAAPQASA